MDSKFKTYDNNLMSVNEFRKRLCNSAFNSLNNDIIFKVKDHELYRAKWAIDTFLYNIEKTAKEYDEKLNWKLIAFYSLDAWMVDFE